MDRDWLAESDDAGGGVIEGAILVAAFIIMLAAFAVAGRYSEAANAVDQAAHDAARAASLERNAADATARAIAVAEANLAEVCDSVDVNVDASEFALPVGQPATVTVTATCHVDLSAVALEGMPTSTTTEATYASPIDTWRART